MSTDATNVVPKSICLLALACAPALAQPCGNPWTLHTGPGPSGRVGYAIAYDAARQRVVLFGGGPVPFSPYLGDTWEWTAAGPGGGGSWALRASSGPSARRNAGLAYDGLRQKVVLFGGDAGGIQSLNDTWEWDGSAWIQLQPPVSPSPMRRGLMAYDVSRQRIVLVSIQFAPNPGRTWEFDGTTWIPSNEPTPIVDWDGGHSMAYDAARSTMVLNGPVYEPPYPGVGTWEREATGWVLKNVGAQFYYQGPSLAYDSVAGRVVYADHMAYTGQTAIWAWDGGVSRWHVVSSNGPPVARHRTPVFDTLGQQLVLFGGQVPPGNAVNETWLFRSDVRSGPRVTDIGLRFGGAPLHNPPVVLNVAGLGMGLTYQWRRNGAALSNGGPYAGVSTPTLTIDPSSVGYSGYYDATVTDACGSTVRPATSFTVACYPDCDLVGGLTAGDFICFLSAYNQGGNYANCDSSTGTPTLTPNDFVCFFNQYISGCS